jgi:hypothetical protein
MRRLRASANSIGERAHRFPLPGMAEVQAAAGRLAVARRTPLLVATPLDEKTAGGS